MPYRLNIFRAIGWRPSLIEFNTKKVGDVIGATLSYIYSYQPDVLCSDPHETFFDPTSFDKSLQDGKERSMREVTIN